MDKLRFVRREKYCDDSEARIVEAPLRENLARWWDCTGPEGREGTCQAETRAVAGASRANPESSSGDSSVARA